MGGDAKSEASSKSAPESEALSVVESMASSMIQPSQSIQEAAQVIAQQSFLQSEVITAVMNNSTQEMVKLASLKPKDGHTRP